MQSSLEPHRRYYRQQILESEGNEPATRYFVRIEIDSLRNDMTEQISRLRADMNIASTKRWIAGAGVAVAIVMLVVSGVVLAAINTVPS